MNLRLTPQEVLVNTKREKQFSIFDLTELILSSTQFNDAGTASENEKKKQIINLHYNTTLGAVNTEDKMTQEYSCVPALNFFCNYRDGSTKRPYNIFSEFS